MMKSPVVSIVMSVFNEEQNLSCAIESCLNQTFQHFEFIIIDDGSTDDTIKILTEYKKKDERIIVIRQKNRGLAASLNEGISLARGEWIARMDADDLSLPERLETQIDYLKCNPEVDVLGAAAYLRSMHAEDLGVMRLPENHDSLIKCMHKSSPFIHPSVVMRREAVISVGGYNERIMRAQDYELWSRLFRNYYFHNLQEPLLIYTVTKRLRLISILQAARVRLLVGWRVGKPFSATFRVVLNILTGVLSAGGVYKSGISRGKYKHNYTENGGK